MNSSAPNLPVTAKRCDQLNSARFSLWRRGRALSYLLHILLLANLIELVQFVSSHHFFLYDLLGRGLLFVIVQQLRVILEGVGIETDDLFVVDVLCDVVVCRQRARVGSLGPGWIPATVKVRQRINRMEILRHQRDRIVRLNLFLGNEITEIPGQELHSLVKRLLSLWRALLFFV